MTPPCVKTRRAGLAALAALLLLAASPPSSPVGTWRTFSDEDGRETGTVTITERDGVLSGVVSAIKDPARRSARCAKCSDDRHDQPVLGMQILRGVREDGDQWDGGQILDPENGRTYKVSMHLEDGGAKLKLRGYIGISLFGRTQTWVRQE